MEFEPDKSAGFRSQLVSSFICGLAARRRQKECLVGSRFCSSETQFRAVADASFGSDTAH